MSAPESGMSKHRALPTLAAILLLGVIPFAQAQDLILDNSDPRFTTYGTWPASTAVAGYQGSNYQTHEANGPVPGALVVDNSDAGFSITGTWPASTAVSGYLGSNYQSHSANGEEPNAIVIDNLQGQASGIWGNSTAVSGYYGSNYQTHAAGSGSNSFNWNTSIAGGTYQVYARWTAAANRATDASYTLTDSSGTHTVTVNQQNNGSTWQLLGSYTFDTSASITLSDQANGYVIADAIKIVPLNAAPNTATWTPNITVPGNYTVYARWSANPNRASNAQYSVTHSGGSSLISVNQQLNGGQWQPLGTFTLDANSKVSLTDQANGYVIADAIQIVSADQAQHNTATWTPNVSGSQQIYAKWTANPNRASNAAYTITDSAGSHTVTVNQQQNGAVWNLLGTFNLNAASTISITDQANGYVIADAIMLTPVNLEPVVYYIHVDHLDTPRQITDASGNVVWQWDNSDPFGNNMPNENPSGVGTFEFDLGYSGMVRDKETNTFYNFYRDCYDPATGRYCQSDPVGLYGGSWTTFAYVNSNPLSYADPLGLGPTSRAPPPRGSVANEYYNTLLSQIRELRPEYRPPSSIGNRDSNVSDAEIAILRNDLANLRNPPSQCTSETVQRWMSKAELEATQNTGLLRGGRDGTHYVTDAANSDPLRATQRLALPVVPEVRVTLEVPGGVFSQPSRVAPAFNMPGGGMERTATGNIPVQILEVH